MPSWNDDWREKREAIADGYLKPFCYHNRSVWGVGVGVDVDVDIFLKTKCWNVL